MILDSIVALLPGLLPASFRGLAFDVPDTSTQVGRRIAEHLFPGHDRSAYDDMGRRPEIITVEGLVVGDDYVARANALRQAFAARGPGTLIHPWLGAMTVVVEDAAEISFSSAELRVARIYASFKRLPATTRPNPISTAVQLAGRIAALVSSASSLMSSGRSIASSVRAMSVARSSRIVGQLFGASASRSRLPGEAAARLRDTLDPAATDQFSFASTVARLSTGIVGSLPGVNAAVAPAAGSTVARTNTAATLFSFAEGLSSNLSAAARSAPSAADQALLAGASLSVLSAAAESATSIPFGSRQDAAAVRDRFVDTVDLSDAALDALSQTVFAGPARAAAFDLAGLRSAVLADINEAIGRLPKLLVIEIRQDVSAFLIAQHLYGDTPDLVEAGYEAIVERNRHRHPAGMPAGRIEAAR